MSERDTTDLALKTIWTVVTMLQKDFPISKRVAMKAFSAAWDMQESSARNDADQTRE